MQPSKYIVKNYNPIFWILPYFLNFLCLAVYEIRFIKLIACIQLTLFFIAYLVLMILKLDFKSPCHNIITCLAKSLIVCDWCGLFVHSGHFSF